MIVPLDLAWSLLYCNAGRYNVLYVDVDVDFVSFRALFVNHGSSCHYQSAASGYIEYGRIPDLNDWIRFIGSRFLG